MDTKLKTLLDKVCQLRTEAAELTDNQIIFDEIEDLIDEIDQAIEQEVCAAS